MPGSKFRLRGKERRPSEDSTNSSEASEDSERRRIADIAEEDAIRLRALEPAEAPSFLARTLQAAEVAATDSIDAAALSFRSTVTATLYGGRTVLR